MTHPADLASRFQAPKNWQWAEFERITGRKIRYGYAAPKDAKTLIITLPGLNEMAEKYFEIARDCLERGYAFCVIDWFGQGASGRHIRGSTKRHSDGFDQDLDDLAYLLQHLPENLKALPKIMLAHSMGGNLGTRYLIKHPEAFKAAAMTAPLYGIYSVSDLPKWAQKTLSAALNIFLGKTFVTFHGKNNRNKNKQFEGNDLTSDPERFKVLDTWMTYNEDLRADDVTFGWVYHALRSCYVIEQEAHNIQIPLLYALGGKEKIVHNGITKDVISRLPHAMTLEIPEARHEIMMERDELRGQFLTQFFNFIQHV